MSDRYISVKVLEEIMRRHKPEYGQDKSKERYAYIEWLGILNAIRRECQPIEAAPAVDSAQWTPVTERLPEERKPVLLSQSFGLMYVGFLIGKAEDGTAIWWDDSSSLIETGGRTFAWMPLPEPYKEGGR